MRDSRVLTEGLSVGQFPFVVEVAKEDHCPSNFACCCMKHKPTETLWWLCLRDLIYFSRQYARQVVYTYRNPCFAKIRLLLLAIAVAPEGFRAATASITFTSEALCDSYTSSCFVYGVCRLILGGAV